LQVANEANLSQPVTREAADRSAAVPTEASKYAYAHVYYARAPQQTTSTSRNVTVCYYVFIVLSSHPYAKKISSLEPLDLIVRR